MVWSAEVNAGAVPTVKVNAWVALELTPLVAVMVMGKLPPAVGVPDSVAVPLPLSVNVTPAGSEPVSLRAAVGFPVEVTVKLFDEPSVKVAESAEVMAGAWSTVRVKDCDASGTHSVGGGDGDRVGAAGPRLLGSPTRLRSRCRCRRSSRPPAAFPSPTRPRSGSRSWSPSTYPPIRR